MKPFTSHSPLSQLLWLAFIFLMLLIVASGITIVLPFVGVDVTDVTVQLVLQGVTQLLTFLLAPLLFVFLFKEERCRFFQLHLDGNSWKQGGVALVMMLLLIPLNDWIAVWNMGWDLGGGAFESACRKLTELSEELMGEMLSQRGVGALLLNLLVIALIPAVSEEIFFRGTIQQILRRWFNGNAHYAVLLTAVIFSLAHGDVFGFVPRVVLGIVLGYLYFYSGSLLVNICAHFANNALIVVLYYAFNEGWIQMDVAEPIRAPWLLTVGCTVGVALLFYLYFWKKNREVVSD